MVTRSGCGAWARPRGDLTRFASARAMVRHAGLAPREKISGTYTGRTKLTGQGRKARTAPGTLAGGRG